MKAIYTLELRDERDVVLCRQRARQMAELLAFDRREQTRISTAVSEIARNAFEYAGGGKASFSPAEQRDGCFSGAAEGFHQAERIVNPLAQERAVQPDAPLRQVVIWDFRSQLLAG